MTTTSVHASDLRSGDVFAIMNGTLRLTPIAQEMIESDAFGAVLLDRGGVHRAEVVSVDSHNAWEVTLSVFVPQFGVVFSDVRLAAAAPCTLRVVS